MRHVLDSGCLEWKVQAFPSGMWQKDRHIVVLGRGEFEMHTIGIHIFFCSRFMKSGSLNQGRYLDPGLECQVNVVIANVINLRLA